MEGNNGEQQQVWEDITIKEVKYNIKKQQTGKNLALTE